MAKIKVGVFGAARGKTMISVLADHPDAELVAVCDKYQPLLDQVTKLADEHHIKVAVYTDFEDFFKHDMDAVVLANYATEHAPFAIRLLDSGRHVLSEVLPCQTMAQAVELAEAVERSGKIYAYAENYCYMLRTFEMQRRREAGEIGEVTYAEGEYVHDCSSIWPLITYGDPKHWRNALSHCNFYCTHSIGPMFTISGLRPVRVTGFAARGSHEVARSLGCIAGGAAGLELITMSNGAIFKSLHGGLKREPSSINYEVYGTKGSMETDRADGDILSVYRESDKLCVGTTERVKPELRIMPELAKAFGGHGGADFYATHFFLQKILGRPDGIKYSIDVYSALDMGICGLLAYRSVLEGNRSYEVPDLRDPAQREKWRHDNACCDPAIAGDQLQPASPFGCEPIAPEVYDRMRKLWLEGKNAE